MNFLTRKHTDVSKDENSSFVIDSSYSLFSVLNKEQMWYFIRCFTDEPDSFWEYVHEKTGNHHLVRHVNDWNYKRPKFKRIKGLDVDVYLAAWDALDLAINAWPTIDEGISYLDFGEDTIFNEKDCIVKYRKEKPLFEHDEWFEFGGVITIVYKTPLGSVIINQNRVNNYIFEIYFSNDVSDEIYNRLVTALEVALKYKSGTLKNYSSKTGKIRLLEGKDVNN